MTGVSRLAALAVTMLAFAALASTTAARASDVKLFRLQSQQAFLRGQLAGMSVDTLGTLRLAPKAERLTALAEPFVLSAAVHPDGWVVGTGNSGKVLLVGRDGKVKELFATAEPEVFAVWVDPKGTVYAGSSPNGKVYRYRDGKATVWFEPKQTYIWQLLGIESGRKGESDLLVATGTQGKLFRVTAPRDGDKAGAEPTQGEPTKGEPAKSEPAKGEPAKGELFWDASDTHVRSLAALPDGGFLAGTAGEGRIVRLSAKGEARTLFDAVEPEVVALAVAPDGTAWAAAVASEASQVPLGAPPPPPSPVKESQGKGGQPTVGQGEPADQGEATVVVGTASGQPVGTRPPGFGGPRSEILCIDQAGNVTSVARLQDDTIHSLLWLGDRLWVGTGLEGKLFTLHDTDLVLEADVEEKQVMALLPDAGRAGGKGNPAFATTNAAAFYRTGAEVRDGNYTSPVLDAQQIARFGSFRWMGEAPPGATLRFSFRSGIAAEPDATWSPWTAPREGREIALTGVPSGRYLQWKLEAGAGPGVASPQLTAAEVSYLQTNLAPRITSLDAMDPGQILVAFNFNPSGQAYEPAHPNRDGIFTTLEEAPEGGEDRLKTLWKQGYRTLRWKAEDPNSDDLTYTLSFRPEGAKEGAATGGTDGAAGTDGHAGTEGHGTERHDGGARAADAGWMPMAQDLTDSYYSFDETALPDGVYRFRLLVTDGKDEKPAEGLTDARISEPVVVDHTPPRLVAVHREGDHLVAEVEDAWNPLREASASIGAGAWQPATPQDGLLDGKHELLTIAAPKGAALVILRVMDAAFNTTTFDLTEAAR